jgi:hypothetical protein
MAKPSKHSLSVARRRRFGLVPVVLTGVAMTLGLSILVGGALSPRAAAQDDPTPTPVELTFNTPTPDASTSDDEPAPPDEEADEGDSEDEGDELSFAADAWAGGYFRGDAEFYGRPWTAVYGALSDYPSATLVLPMTDDPTEPVELVFDGLDDEAPAINPIALEVNGQRVFEGEAWFAEWDGVGNGANAPWTTVRITIPPDLLVKGDNRVTLRNLTESANFGSTPYVLLSEGVATSSEDGLFGATEEVAITVVVED